MINLDFFFEYKSEKEKLNLIKKIINQIKEPALLHFEEIELFNTKTTQFFFF